MKNIYCMLTHVDLLKFAKSSEDIPLTQYKIESLLVWSTLTHLLSKKKKKMAENSSSQQQDRPRCCYLNWMVQQEKELDELNQVFNHHPEDNEKLLPVIKTIMNHFKEYKGNRIKLALNDPNIFFSPTWCSTFEKSYFWIAGCRPTLGIRLVYALCGSEVEAQLADFLQGVSIGNLGDLSASQLQMISELQGKTIKEEDLLSRRMASMEEDTADKPLALIAHRSKIVGEYSEQVGKAIDKHGLALASILEDADNLRLKTLMELINILTPLQTVDLLLVAKKLHLSMHKWGETRDRQP